jgi:hypothetical protein
MLFVHRSEENVAMRRDYRAVQDAVIALECHVHVQQNVILKKIYRHGATIAYENLEC